MSFSKVFARTVVGLDAPLLTIEVHISPGLPGIVVVGLPEAAVRESKDRVRSAIINSGFDFPQYRLTINLAPADLPKDGAKLDLPIALGVLAASGQLPPESLERVECLGELALSGELRPIKGALTVALHLKGAGRALIVPEQNALEAGAVSGVEVLGGGSLKQVVDHLSGAVKLQVLDRPAQQSDLPVYPDLRDVLGQPAARRALEVAASGRHSLIMSGPPGVGKTMLASRLPGLLPPLSQDQAFEVMSIYSICALETPFAMRPFRAPHHTASPAALIGGGSRPRPGEVTLAHLGVLFLDELPEFDRKVLEVLRQPLEGKTVSISRAAAQATFPADFQLIAAMNPCPCGYLGDPSGRCHCSADQVLRYRAKISGPLMDRLDLWGDVPRPALSQIHASADEESTEQVRVRVLAAHARQLDRQGKPNAALDPAELPIHAPLGEAQKTLMSAAQAKLDLSLRAYHRVVKVARTIADLAGSEFITSAHLAEALGYRAKG